MGAVIGSPWGGVLVRPTVIPRTVPHTGTAPRPVPGGIKPPVPVAPAMPQTGARATEDGRAIARPTVTAQEAAKEAERRKKDCRCPPSVNCEGKPSVIGQSGMKPWVEYQLYIANIKAAFAFTYAEGKLTEWSFAGYNRWDGFWQPLCTLVEAKGAYDWIDRIKNGTGIWGNVLKGFHKQFRKQRTLLNAQRKRTGGSNIKLEWHFKQKSPYTQFREMPGIKTELAKLKAQGITIHHTPFEDSGERKQRERETEQFYKNNPDLFV